jgi:hypothetical protein
MCHGFCRVQASWSAQDSRVDWDVRFSVLNLRWSRAKRESWSPWRTINLRASTGEEGFVAEGDIKRVLQCRRMCISREQEGEGENSNSNAGAASKISSTIGFSPGILNPVCF